MNKQTVLLCIITFILLISVLTLPTLYTQPDPLLINDIARMNPTYVQEIVLENQTAGLIEAVMRANEENLTISIGGKRLSQGGHTYYDDSVHLDMKKYNKILNLDVDNKIITVQSGATWEDVQNYVNEYDLALKVMQSSNIFTIGGSMSANVHGRDPNYGPIIETIRSFRLLLANGTVVNVSREENTELFTSAIGGYGLIGAILDVDIELTDNLVYVKETSYVNYTHYNQYFKETIENKSNVGLHYGRLSIAPGETFLKEMYVTNYVETTQYDESVLELVAEEKNVARNKFLFGLSRHSDWGKTLRWNLQKKLEENLDEIEIISRNNAMRPPIEFLDYYSEDDVDILQEYFIPRENFTTFIEDLREVMIDERINLLSVTIRDVPQNEEAVLSYSQSDSFAVVLYINQKLAKDELAHARVWTQRLVDLAIDYNGTYYLTYQLFPTQTQFEAVYPAAKSFRDIKEKYDPNERFVNKFYAQYLQ